MSQQQWNSFKDFYKRKLDNLNVIEELGPMGNNASWSMG